MFDTVDDSEARRLHPPGTYVSCLVVALECDRPMAGSARYNLDGVEQVTIGRGSDRAVTRDLATSALDVRIPGRSLSSEHARLIRIGHSWGVEDLGSRNGTFVDGKRVSRSVLRPENLLEVGHTFMRVRPLALPEGVAKDLEVPRDGDDDEYGTVDDGFAVDLARLSRLVVAGLPALIVGESGTGKEVLARRLHVKTGRSGPFVAINCGAIPAPLVESQLFGHVKGAFSGAVRDEPGFVRAADGGTLFLDEIADLPRSSQAALLRVLQEREVIPVGATRPVSVDVRLLSATHQSLEHLVDRGEFRQDLFARLAGCVIELPALRDRRDDMGVLVASLLRRLAPDATQAISLMPDVGRALLAYEWPMNVRELERCLLTCVALAQGGRITAATLPPTVAEVLQPLYRPGRTATPLLTEEEERLRLDLLVHLSKYQGRVADVARAMGKARTQIHRWCKRFDLDPKTFRN